MIYVLTVLVMLGMLSSKFLGDDNVVEQSVETIVKDVTNIDIDLTPNSNKDNN